MAKIIIEDIVVSKKHDTPVRKREQPIKVRAETVHENHTTPVVEHPFIFSGKKQQSDDTELFEEDERTISKSSQITLWIVCIASVATLLFFLSMLFATATVTITPKNEPIALNATYVISTSTSAAGLHYEIMSVTKTATQSLQTNGSQQVSRQAVGQAIIYNNYSSASQRLINNTRLAAANGNIYRIRNSVTVPGQKTVNGVKTPGSVQVDIIADQPGDTYNMTVSDFKGDFTIPGFVGTPQYNGFYARLSTDITGGFVGTAKTVDAGTLAAGRDTLKSQLKDQLVKALYAELPATDTLFKDDYFISYTDAPDDAETDSYTISDTAVAYAVVFHTDELAKFIAQNSLSDLSTSSSVDIVWGNDATVAVSGVTSEPWTENTLTAIFSGTAKAVWRYNAAAILSQIAGQDKSVLQDILNANKDSIATITASIRPQWKSTFPSDSNKITIIDSVRDTTAE